MTWKGTRKGVTEDGERYYEHHHPHKHRGDWRQPDVEHEHPHRHHSKQRHRHAWPK